MAYSQFTFHSAKEQFGFTNSTDSIFTEFGKIECSSWLKETLDRTLEVAFVSEKARSEAIVMPILIEVRTINKGNFGIFSGIKFDVDKEKGLNEECDFLLGKSSQNFEIEAPTFCLVEAKENDIEEGLGQCIAQMYGANLFNEKENKPLKNIYGCITTGEVWQFLKLNNNHITIEKKRYYLDNLPNIIGFIQEIINDII